MSLIDSTYFKQDLAVVINEFSDFPDYITKYEPKILNICLGYELAKLVSDYDPDTSEERIKQLVEGDEFTVTYNGQERLIKWNGFKSVDDNLIAYYVWYWYQRARMVMDSGIGAVRPGSENTSRGDLSMKAMAAWDAMVDQFEILYLFLDANKSVYPEWYCEPIKRINSLDI